MKIIFLIVLLVFVLSPTALPVSAGDYIISYGKETRSPTGHEPFIRQAFELAISAGKKGNHPFGALLVYQNKAILTAENTVHADSNVYGHAEINLMIKARREIPPEVLRESTMYVSTAPCMLCCSAMWYRDIARVVYGVSYKTFSKVTGVEDKSIPCEKLYQETGKPLEWIGPVLDEEGIKVFYLWPQDSSQSSILKNLEELGIVKTLQHGDRITPIDK